MLSSSCIFTFILHWSLAILSHTAAVNAVGSKSQKDGNVETKGTMLYQSSTKVLSGVASDHFDDFESLVDEFDSDSKAEVHGSGAEASKVQDALYATGSEALPVMLQDLKIASRTGKTSWYEAGICLLSGSRLIGFIQDFFLVIVGIVGYYLWKGCQLPTPRLPSSRPPNCGLAAANKTTRPMTLDTDELVQAMYSDNKEYLQKLLHERSPDASEEVWGCTALHVAAHCSCAPAAEALLMRGASANTKDTWDETPLHFTSRSGSTEVCELLIACGADLNAMNARDWTPLVVAAHAGQEAVCKLLLSKGAGVGDLADKDLPPLLTSLLVCNMFPTCDQSRSGAELKPKTS